MLPVASTATPGKLEEAGVLGARLSTDFYYRKVKITTLIDTGAAKTLLHENVFRKLIKKTDRCSLLKPTIQLMTVNGDILPT